MSTMNSDDINIIFEDEGGDTNDDINVVFEDEGESIDVIYEDLPVVPVSVVNHSDLHGRSDPEQHPIGAITSLDGELADRPTAAITDAEILAL